MRSVKRFFVIVVVLFEIHGGFAQTILEVKQTAITVSDMDKILPFYTGILNFKTVSVQETDNASFGKLFGIRDQQVKIKIAKLQLGDEFIELIDFIDPEGRPIPQDSKSNDLWFQHIAIVTNDMDQAYQILRQHKVTHVSTAPQTLPDYIPAAVGIKAFYFRDPDGHNLEIIYFPEGKGDPKWQSKKGGPFIGIDHTAIGISDTDWSTSFYRDLLGLKVAGHSENYGPEQEHLNQVFGARLWITGLKAPKGIGVEFLEYISPPGGRLYPPNTKLNDLWHWYTQMEVTDLQSYYQKVLKSNIEVVSSGVVDIPAVVNQGSKGLMIKDPDGHAILLTETKQKKPTN